MIVSQVPVEDVEPIGERLIVRKYVKPEKVGSIWLNPAWRTDHSRALWEVVKVSERAQAFFESDAAFGERLEEDWIVITQPNHGVHAPPVALSDGADAFLIHAQDVMKVIPWVPGEERELRRGLQIGGEG